MAERTADMDKYYEEEANAVSQIHRSLEAFRSAYKNGDITDEDLSRVADVNDVAKDELLRYCNMSRLEMEQDPYYKSDLSDVRTIFPALNDGQVFPDDFKDDPMYAGYDLDNIDVKITRHGNTYSCESDYLGNFSYNNSLRNADGTININRGGNGGAIQNEWKVGFKTIKEDDGTTSCLPVIEFDGTDTGYRELNLGFVGAIQTKYPPQIPDGVKSLDYAFANHTALELTPDRIPDSVTTMHCAFKNCSSLTMYDDAHKLVIPSTVVDMSSTFEGCSSLQGDFKSRDKDGKEYDQLPRELVTCVAGFKGCEELDDTYKATTKYGRFLAWGRGGWWSNDGAYKTENAGLSFDMPTLGEGYTPYLSAQYAKGVFDSIASTNATRKKADGTIDDKFVEETQANLKFNGDKGHFKNEEGLDADKLESAKAASLQVSSGGVMDAHIITNPELISDVSTDHKIKNGDGTFVNDWTGLKTSLKNRLEEKSLTGEKVFIYGGLGLLAGKLTGKGVVGAAVGLGGFFASNYIKELPQSIYPIVNFTVGLLPEPMKSGLQDWAKNLPGYAYEQNKEIDKHNAEIIEANKFYDDQYNVGNEWKEKRVSSVLGNALPQVNNGFNCDKYMLENAKECSKQMTFIATAMAEIGDNTSGKYIKDVMDPTVKAMTDYWQSNISNGSVTDAQKESMRSYYLGLASALESYDKGAQLGDQMYYPNNELYQDLSKTGLNVVNRNYMDSMMSSLVQMDNMYHFMNDETWQKLSEYDISGVDIANIRNYDDTYMSRIASGDYEGLKYMQKAFTVDREGTTEQKANGEGKYDHAYAMGLMQSGSTVYDYGYDKHKYDNISGMPTEAKKNALAADWQATKQALEADCKIATKEAGRRAAEQSLEGSKIRDNSYEYDAAMMDSIFDSNTDDKSIEGTLPSMT